MTISSDTKENLSNGNSFKVNNELGLNYELSSQEKETRYAEVEVEITAYNYCPNESGNKCQSEIVAQKKKFKFIINVYGSPPTTLPKTDSPDTEYVPPDTKYVPLDSEHVPPDIESSETEIFHCLDRYISYEGKKTFQHMFVQIILWSKLWKI